LATPYGGYRTSINPSIHFGVVVTECVETGFPAVEALARGAHAAKGHGGYAAVEEAVVEGGAAGARGGDDVFVRRRRFSLHVIASLLLY
jgi:hypothetical protein